MSKKYEYRIVNRRIDYRSAPSSSAKEAWLLSGIKQRGDKLQRRLIVKWKDVN